MLDERLKQQNNGEPWIDCNRRSRPRAHHWVFERTGEVGAWFRCNRCPVATIVPQERAFTRSGALNQPVPPPPFLR